jgi:hypothetical protein
MKRNTATHLIKRRYTSPYRSVHGPRRDTKLPVVDKSYFGLREKWADKKNWIFQHLISDVLNFVLRRSSQTDRRTNQTSHGTAHTTNLVQSSQVSALGSEKNQSKATILREGGGEGGGFLLE